MASTTMRRILAKADSLEDHAEKVQQSINDAQDQLGKLKLGLREIRNEIREELGDDEIAVYGAAAPVGL